MHCPDDKKWVVHANLDIQLPQVGGQGKGELLSQGGEKARRDKEREKRKKPHYYQPASSLSPTWLVIASVP